MKLDSSNPDPVSSSTFEFCVSDIFNINGRGIVVVGNIKKGTIHINQSVAQLRHKVFRRIIVIQYIEKDRKLVQTATHGDIVGLLLKDIEIADISIGDMLTA